LVHPAYYLSCSYTTAQTLNYGTLSAVVCATGYFLKLANTAAAACGVCATDAALFTTADSTGAAYATAILNQAAIATCTASTTSTPWKLSSITCNTGWAVQYFTGGVFFNGCGPCDGGAGMATTPSTIYASCSLAIAVTATVGAVSSLTCQSGAYMNGVLCVSCSGATLTNAVPTALVNRALISTCTTSGTGVVATAITCLTGNAV